MTLADLLVALELELDRLDDPLAGLFGRELERTLRDLSDGCH